MEEYITLAATNTILAGRTIFSMSACITVSECACSTSSLN